MELKDGWQYLKCGWGFFATAATLALLAVLIPVLAVRIILGSLAFIFVIVGCVLTGNNIEVQPGKALIVTSFGRYVGTIKKNGLFWWCNACTQY